MSRGWECPKCGTVWAPYVARCHTCQPVEGMSTGGVGAAWPVAICSHVWSDVDAGGGQRCTRCGAFRSATYSLGAQEVRP